MSTTPSCDHSDLPNTPQKRWSIAFSAALMNALQSGGFFFTPTTLMPLIVSDFSLDLSLSTVPIAIGKIAYVLLLIPGGMLVDHYGPRRCVLGGVFGLALIMTLYALFVSSFPFLVAIHVLLATVASVSGVPVYSLFIAQWFDGGIGLAMGLVLAGYSASGTAIPALLGPVASEFGWRVAMGSMCGLLWFVGLPVAFFFLHEYDYGDEREADGELEVGAQSEMLPGEKSPLLPSPQPVVDDMGGVVDHKSWTFVGFAFSYILLQYCFGCFSENLMFLLTLDRGMSLSLASLYFSALNFSSFTAKLVGGHLGDRFDRFHVASAASGLAAVGILFLFISPPGLDADNIPYLTSSPIAFLLFTVLFGFGYGATFNSLYALTPLVFGRRNLGRTQSTLFGLGLAGNAVGSMLTGVLRSSYGTYQRPFLIAAVACTANFFVFNVTRLTLGGSLEGLKGLNEEQRSIATSGTFQGIEELEALEEAARRRVGLVSDIGSPKLSPLGNFPSFKGSGFFGASFAPPSATEESLHPDISYNATIPTSVSAMSLGLSRSYNRNSGTGMQIDHGFPIVRDWSNSSLRSSLKRAAKNNDDSTSTPGLSRSNSRGRGIRRSSTLEAMIDSGILSASLEAAGYLGSPQNGMTPTRSPPYGSPRPSSMAMYSSSSRNPSVLEKPSSSTSGPSSHV